MAVNVMWFRRGLRFHDNPALLAAVRGKKNFMAIYIYDNFFYNAYPSVHQNGFLLECLIDLDRSLRQVGGRLLVFSGNPLMVLRHIHQFHPIASLCFQKDHEPIWQERNVAVRKLCKEIGAECFEEQSQTLWELKKIYQANGGTPILSLEMFEHVTMSLDDPPRPVEDVDLTGVNFVDLEPCCFPGEFQLFAGIPELNEVTPPEPSQQNVTDRTLVGGERRALEHMQARLLIEAEAFRKGSYRPNQAQPNLLNAQPMSLSAALALGALSSRKFYWEIHDLFRKICKGQNALRSHVAGQMIWRDFFYALAMGIPNFDKAINNPTCLQLPWDENETQFRKWCEGRTGYPFIDAALRQLIREGWIHHQLRSALVLFLTRGDLWLSWEKGAEFFSRFLVDCDWSLNNGNWMYLSAAVFDKGGELEIDPVLFGQRLEPSGDFIRKYIPELASFEFEHIHEPWTAPLDVQIAANCVIGRDYPERIVIHKEASERNKQKIVRYRQEFLEALIRDGYCHVSSQREFYAFFGIKRLPVITDDSEDGGDFRNIK